MRGRIRDLGYEVKAHKASIALSMGAGVFLILLAAGAGYDLIAGKASIWSPLGITRDTLMWVAGGGGAGGLLLLAQGLMRQRSSEREVRLDELEQEYAELLDRKSLME